MGIEKSDIITLVNKYNKRCAFYANMGWKVHFFLDPIAEIKTMYLQ